MGHDASVEQQILATIDKWVEQELRPIAREHDQADAYPTELVEQMKSWDIGATISEKYAVRTQRIYLCPSCRVSARSDALFFNCI